MDEQQFLHNLAAKTNVNIDVLIELYHNEKIWDLIRRNKKIEAIALARSLTYHLELVQAKWIIDEFARPH